MASFTCLCGVVYKESKNKEELDGILYSLFSFDKLLEDISKNINDFSRVSKSQERYEWILNYFIQEGLHQLSNHEVVDDIISKEINSSKFASTFSCPNCGRLAICNDSGVWEFFVKEHPKKKV